MYPDSDRQVLWAHIKRVYQTQVPPFGLNEEPGNYSGPSQSFHSRKSFHFANPWPQLLKRAARVWADEFVPDRRRKRQETGRAALHWRLRLLLAALNGWRRRAEDLAAKRVLKVKAAIHLERNHAKTCLVTWIRWAEEKVDFPLHP